MPPVLRLAPRRRTVVIIDDECRPMRVRHVNIQIRKGGRYRQCAGYKKPARPTGYLSLPGSDWANKPFRLSGTDRLKSGFPWEDTLSLPADG